MKRLLVVDDEESILKLLTHNLEREGYEVETAVDGQQAYDMAKDGDYDFIILDLMLPKKSGMDVCKELRQNKVTTPILILTAKDDHVDTILGLELGADDYMTKPFNTRELVARMNAVYRRIGEQPVSEEDEIATEAEESEIRVGDIVIYPAKYEVYIGEELIELTPKEFELLQYMAKRKNRILSRNQLLNAIWNYDYTGGTRIVDVHISHLREKIEKDTKNPEYIQTVRGFGYRLKDEDE
jgi:two-component system alkaline phosphatase synthesis response regulator PhoP